METIDTEEEGRGLTGGGEEVTRCWQVWFYGTVRVLETDADDSPMTVFLML